MEQKDKIEYNIENPSICIPRIEGDITKWQVSDVFNKLALGKLKRIDIVYNHKQNTNKIFVHFKHWIPTTRNDNIKNLLNSGGNFKLVHNFPQYWKCFKSRF